VYRECWRAGAFAVLLAFALAAFACSGEDEAEEAVEVILPENGSRNVYLALGDSIAAGSGSSDVDSSSYVALIDEALRARYGETLELQSLAVAGHATQNLIDEQLGPAVERLLEGNVRLVTVTIGGNDLGQFAAEVACLPDPADLACPLEDGLLDVERRLSLILRELRNADPEVTIMLQLYPNLFSGTAHQFERPADIAFDLLNGVITGVARRHDVLLADPRHAFVAEGLYLTHMADPTPDAHPNDDGYRAIADAFLEALGLDGG
jgi:lysophospholipase L1-like esterase